MIDPFGRRVTYLRLSVTDRCDLRCLYCMAEDMEFLPKADVLSLEELGRLCGAFIDLGVRKLRLTGGEPLVRRGIMTLIERLGGYVASGQLDELTLTTNGTQLAKHAAGLAAAGMRRINVSLDTLDPETFRRITRLDRLDSVLDGIAAAKQAGLHVKINTVALKGINEDQIDGLIAWCGAQGHDITLIETMPLGDVAGYRDEQYLPLDETRRRLERNWTLTPSAHRSGGPARYVTVRETGGRLGFITPMTHNFCEGCNRVRVTCTGTMYQCLGQEDSVDLRAPLRASEADEVLRKAILGGIAHKPKGHDFVIDRDHQRPALARHMSMTGG
ncbi:MAG TPA: GTP 3',8-cyclase MoaA [Patescibacteria group bacterium]|nr:GTP 3',8-cyclase MoaA [Patescibacteria group bacterium]